MTHHNSIEIQPVTQPLNGTVRPPGSKSITNRALIVAALADGQSRLSGVLDSQDTRVMFDSLRRLGIACEHDSNLRTATVTGCGGSVPQTAADLWLENSGTSIRFLTALCAVAQGTFRLDGNTRMRERPIQDLADALTALGPSVRCLSAGGCPPVEITTTGLSGGMTRVAGSVSSQFLSALLMAAPIATNNVEIRIDGELVSRPYVEMTIGVMSEFGVTVTADQSDRFVITPQTYRAADYDIEPDASAASYFLAAAAITGGTVTVDGLSKESLQGDVGFAEALEQMGCDVSWTKRSITVKGTQLHGIDIDMNAISDTAQTLSAVAVFADSPTRIRNVGHMRHKETDRIDAVATELRRMGIKVETTDSDLTIHPGHPQPATVQTYDDHRMAMSFALIGLRVPGIRIADPDCTAKTYPDYFRDLDRLIGRSQ